MTKKQEGKGNRNLTVLCPEPGCARKGRSDSVKRHWETQHKQKGESTVDWPYGHKGRRGSHGLTVQNNSQRDQDGDGQHEGKPLSSINARFDKQQEAQLLRCDHCWEAKKQRRRFYRSRGALVKHLSTCAKRKTTEELIRNEQARIKGLE